LTDKPEHPDGPASEQDQSLEAQLDALLDDLEAAEPQMVPKDLRKHKPEPTAPQPVAQEPAQPAPTPSPAEAQPKPAKKGLDLDEIAALASSMLDNQIEQTIAAAKPKEADTPPAQPQPRPQAVETPEKPAKKGLDLESIASMASNLLDKQINDMVAESAGANPAPPTALASDAESTATDAPAPGPAPGPDVTSKALGEDELSAQIQALLNHVQAQPDFGETGSAKDAPDPAPDTHEAKAPSSGAGAVSIDEIDAMLAESAEHAIQHEPQPVSEVPGTDEILAAQALEEDAQHPLDAQPAYQPQGWNEKPAPPPTPVVAQPAGATADDVADELDRDDIPAPAKPAPAKAHRPDPHDALEPDAVTINQSALKKAEKTLLRLCGKVNRPLNRLSPEMKDTVGYVGVVVLLPALCLILYGLVF